MLRRILAILNKDLRDAGRDGRIIILLLLPIGLAVFYNATIDDGDTLPRTKVAIVEPDGGRVADQLRAAAQKSVRLDVRSARDEREARRLVARDDVDVGVVVGAREADQAGVLLPEDASPTAQSVVAIVPTALARAAGRQAPARVAVENVRPENQKPYQQLKQNELAVLLVIVLLVAFVAMMIVPIQTAEELETETFGALRLAVSSEEILAAKALAGLVYTAVGVALTLMITRLGVDNVVLFFGAALGLTVSLVGFGLLLGLLVPNANAINTYGAFLLFPFIGLAGAVFFVDSGIFSTVLDLLPFSQAAKLLSDGLTDRSPFRDGVVPWLVIAAWSAIGYALLTRIAARREL